jgi:beta-phosphoglucomutase-like phosphatase (HAD superfamily)
MRRVFDALVSVEDAARGKPAPDLFLEAARRLDVEPASCLVVEDAVLGVVAACEAGMLAIALIEAGTTGEEHRRAGARLCLESLRELTPERVEQLAARND